METETTRVEAFSDGMFAIAITLLILEMKVPSPGQGQLAAALVRQWPSYLAFFLSFAFIGIMWMNHHRMFTHIQRSNDTLLVLNLLLLLGVTAVPFPTAVLATYLGTTQQRTAALFYNGVFVVIAFFFNLTWRYAVSRRLLDESMLMSAATISRQYAFGPLMYILCFIVAWFDVRVSIALSVALAIFYALPPGLIRKSTT
jgi:uncharacterized membrane protein